MEESWALKLRKTLEVRILKYVYKLYVELSVEYVKVMNA